MLDVHPPHHAASTWRDFFIHIATIVIGLLIAVALEQTVEYIHHRHQRHQLQEDLHNEAEQNLQVIDRDLKMQNLEPWFDEATLKAGAASPHQEKIQITLPPAPCLPGSVGTAVRFGRYSDDRPRVLEIRADRGAERPDHLADLGRPHLTVLDAHLDQDRVDHEATDLVLLSDLEEALRLGVLVDQRSRRDGGIPLPTRRQENDTAVD